ncbi:hypothetical protein LWI29_034246 [Acer saccharum]|uniref:Cyclin n=1 Tax=Acer saccharum TaxID=4024 RepID=A0AA39W507_ACESA|nr:hypothetical protein LWI29_034246 [Acer saccharum]
MVLHSGNKLVELESETYSALGLDDSSGISGNPRVLSLLSSILERSIQRNEISLKASRKQEVVTISHGTRAPPSMSIGQYIERIFKCYNNAYFAKVGGVSTAELNRLEMKFLFTLDFKLHVTTEDFRKYCSQLETEAAGERRIEQLNQANRLEKGRPNKGKSFTTSYSFRAK